MNSCNEKQNALNNMFSKTHFMTLEALFARGVLREPGGLFFRVSFVNLQGNILSMPSPFLKSSSLLQGMTATS